MQASVDEREGLIKTVWENVRNRVFQVAPQFARMVDELSPDHKFPLYLAYYPYGALKGDTISPFIPKKDGGSYRLNSNEAPRDVMRHLGYGSTSSPFGMLLEKTLEYYIDLKETNVTIPWKILHPGNFFPLGRIIQGNSSRIYSPNSILSAVSGGRSVFMLPKIGCVTNHFKLQKEWGVQSPAPKSLGDHWKIFNEIINNKKNSKWRSCIIYFSKKWFEKINKDKAWIPIKKILLEQAYRNHEYERNYIYYKIAYSIIQNKKNLKPNPYLVDIACHLFSLALGAFPGHAPLYNENLLPVKIIQQAFVESYGMKKYIPTIIGPAQFNFENKENEQVYYSLQNLKTLSFSPKSRKQSTTIFEMRELNHIIGIFLEELSKDGNILSGTIFGEIAKRIKFDFYHNKSDKCNHINKIENILKIDERFGSKYTHISAPGSVFSVDSPFLKGCISVGSKKN